MTECLNFSGNDRDFVAKLLLVTSDAAGVRLSSANRNNLMAMEES